MLKRALRKNSNSPKAMERRKFDSAMDLRETPLNKSAIESIQPAKSS
jgi:hypothetical protein